MRDKAAKVWAFRMRAELEAAARFGRLADRLAASGAAALVVKMANDAAADEQRHADQCAALVRHFGKEPDLGKCSALREVAPSDLTPRERVLYEVIALSCITETLSAALLGAMVEQARDNHVKATVHAILRDEIDHSRLGWAHLSMEHARGCAGMLGDYLPAMLAATVTEELFRAAEASPEDEDALAGLGSLSRADRKALFVGTMREIVFVGLERFGVDTSCGSRWLDEKLSL